MASGRAPEASNKVMAVLLQRVNHWLGIDRAIFFNLCGRFWSLLAGPVSILLIGTYLTKVEQGFFYTFSTILGLQVILELGFNQCLVQFTSHEYARLQFREGRLEGDSTALGRLLGLGRLALLWYAVLGLLLMLVIGPAGQAFLGSRAVSGTNWVVPWWLLCGAAGLNLAIQPVWFILEGCNQVAAVNAYRTLNQVALGVAAWAALLAQARLYAAPVAAAAGLLVGVGLLAATRRPLIAQLWRHSMAGAGGLLRELWPFQWRMAISFASGYLIFSLFTPVLFYVQGPEVAGQMGMTWQIVGALSMMASAWVTTKAPRYGMLISQGQFAELDALFRRVTTQAVVLCALGGVCLLAAVAVLKNHFALGSRFLDLIPTVFLVIATVVNQAVFGQACYLRAHKREPFLGVSVANALATSAGVIGGTLVFGAFGACLAYAVTQTLMLPLATAIFRAKRRAWHPDAAVTVPAGAG